MSLKYERVWEQLYFSSQLSQDEVWIKGRGDVKRTARVMQVVFPADREMASLIRRLDQMYYALITGDQMYFALIT